MGNLAKELDVDSPALSVRQTITQEDSDTKLHSRQLAYSYSNYQYPTDMLDSSS